MDVEEILAALREIIQKAEGDGRELTEEEVTAYEDLEKKLQTAQRSQAVRERQAAYDTVNRAGVHVAPPKADDGLEKAFDSYLRTGKENADLSQLKPRSPRAPAPRAATWCPTVSARSSSTG